MRLIYEIITYILYIYSFIILFIKIKPTPILLISLFIYCFSTTWYIFNDCKNLLINKKSPKLLLTAQYSLMCTISFYIIHITWKKYKKELFYIIILLGLPFFYFLNIKICEYLYECRAFHNFNTASYIYFVVTIINLIYIYFNIDIIELIDFL